MCWFKKKEYKIFQRFYKYKGHWDRLLCITKSKKIADDIARSLTDKGISEDGRRDYEGIIG